MDTTLSLGVAARFLRLVMGAMAAALSSWSAAIPFFPDLLTTFPVPTTAAMPGVDVVETRVSTYQPFTVRAQFSRDFCLGSAPGEFATVSLRGNVLNVQLAADTSESGCVRQRDIKLPGLPSGSYRIRISVTSHYGAPLSPPV